MLNEDASPIVIFVNFRESATMLSDILTGQTAPNGSLLRCDFLSGDIVKQKVHIVTLSCFVSVMLYL